MRLKLWIDDIRTPPDETWDWVFTSDAAIAYMKTWQEDSIGEWFVFDTISFDHDLGGDDTTRPVVIWMIENNIRFRHYHVHSANPIGYEWLTGMIERYLV